MRLNAIFQRSARKDKEESLKEACRRIEENNRRGRTRDLFKEVKLITGSNNPRCGAMRSSNGKIATEEDAVKKRWKEYTEGLYKKDQAIPDIFTQTEYEDEPEVLESEVREALRQIPSGKAAGCDGIPIEMLKAGGDESVKVLTALCNCIWKKKSWPKDWKKSIFVPLLKKGDMKECGNYRTIALITQTSKVLLKILQKRLEYYLGKELPCEQAGFRRGRGTRDHIANMRWMMEEARDFQQKVYMCFIDYRKAFDCVDHQRLWVVLMEMGTPMHLIVLLKNLYMNQEATVRTEFGETESFLIEKGVRQGCILSPILFNIYAERIMRKALTDWDGGIKIGGRDISNLRYADDTTLLTSTENELSHVFEKVRLASAEAGLFLNVDKTKIMTTGDATNINIGGKAVECVNKFSFLGAMLTNDGACVTEVKRRITMGKAAMGRLTKIWRDRGITLCTKVALVKALVFPIVLYGSETWTMGKNERKKVDAFELWCWRRILRVSWMERKTNAWVLDQIKPVWTLESRIAKSAMSYFGHVVRADNSLEKAIMFGKMEGTRRQGRPRRKWLDTISELTEESVGAAATLTRNRSVWRMKIMNVARGRNRLDGTR